MRMLTVFFHPEGREDIWEEIPVRARALVPIQIRSIALITDHVMIRVFSESGSILPLDGRHISRIFNLEDI